MPSGTPAQNDAYTAALLWLGDMGLSDLADWLWNEIINNTPTQALYLNLHQQPAYKREYPAMEEMRRRGISITEAEYKANERQYRAILRQAGADPTRYNTSDSLKDYFLKEISPSELKDRADTLNFIRSAPTTTARMAHLFKENANLDMKEEDIFNMLLGSDTTLAETYARTTGTPLNVDVVQNALRQALQQEVASFMGGGGHFAENKGIGVGLMGKEEEAF